MHYYEVENKQTNTGGMPAGVVAFDTLEEAIKYADENGADEINEIGGSWDDFRKCWFCCEWVPVCELNKNDLCDHCENYLISRGEI